MWAYLSMTFLFLGMVLILYTKAKYINKLKKKTKRIYWKGEDRNSIFCCSSLIFLLCSISITSDLNAGLQIFDL